MRMNTYLAQSSEKINWGYIIGYFILFYNSSTFYRLAIDGIFGLEKEKSEIFGLPAFNGLHCYLSGSD